MPSSRYGDGTSKLPFKETESSGYVISLLVSLHVSSNDVVSWHLLSRICIDIYDFDNLICDFGDLI